MALLNFLFAKAGVKFRNVWAGAWKFLEEIYGKFGAGIEPTFDSAPKQSLV